ncbi:hypothetical protein GOP47_0001784 [Adiantum capillus-veneris]|uniref:Uncharacterized protein n=1 Tax=Adiantum capillus-veneris TaxID=13818 RepID=A0A9D4VA86_ADICA|nr:hypothetical protein GOP47_0001784 [Adiantum capillus-veneris]
MPLYPTYTNEVTVKVFCPFHVADCSLSTVAFEAPELNKYTMTTLGRSMGMLDLGNVVFIQSLPFKWPDDQRPGRIDPSRWETSLHIKSKYIMDCMCLPKPASLEVVQERAQPLEITLWAATMIYNPYASHNVECLEFSVDHGATNFEADSCYSRIMSERHLRLVYVCMHNTLR